ASEDTNDDDTTPPVKVDGDLRPSFEIGETWTVAVSYRSQGAKMNELFKALTDELADPTPMSDVFSTAPSAVVPDSSELWSEPLFWTFGVINTNYVPETDNDFYRYAVDTNGEAQPITIIKVVADKDLNSVDISESLDPVFYLVLRESDMQVRGIHYNYKVRSGRNTVVLEMPENEGALPTPGADQSFFLVPYLMPAFPLDATAPQPYTLQLADGTQEVTPIDADSARAAFDLSF